MNEAETSAVINSLDYYLYTEDISELSGENVPAEAHSGGLLSILTASKRQRGRRETKYSEPSLAVPTLTAQNSKSESSFRSAN